MDFATLYKQNCAGCHGENGKNGVAISLDNPVYLAVAGEATVRQVTANGVAGTLMPAFEKSAGGTLTDQQIDSLVQGILQRGAARTFSALTCAVLCGKCEERSSARAESLWRVLRPLPRGRRQGSKKLIAATRSRARLSILLIWRWSAIKVCGARSSPDGRTRACRIGARIYRAPGSRAMTDQEITDIVAWLAAQRTAP